MERYLNVGMTLTLKTFNICKLKDKNIVQLIFLVSTYSIDQINVILPRKIILVTNHNHTQNKLQSLKSLF